jgi:predicted RNase H-like HicB family nuclease
MNFNIELDREDDGRWIAEIPDLPGVMTNGKTRDDAIAHVQALALRVLADRLEHAEAAPDLLSVTFKAA